MKKQTKILIGALAGVSVVASASMYALSKLSKKYINLAVKRGSEKYNNDKKRDETFAKKDPEEISRLLHNYKDAEARAAEWAKNTPVEKCSIMSDDGLALYGDLFRQPLGSRNYIIIVHGYNCNRQQMYAFGPDYYDMGYNVLFVDMRSHGESEGEYIGMGWLERLDLKKWCEFIVARDPYSNIVLYGQSMGAASVLMACGEELPKNVKACIEDSGFTSVEEIFDKSIKNIVKFGIPSTTLLNIANRQFKKVAKYSIYDGNTIEQVKKSHTPTLFIHCKDDSYIPFSMVIRLYNSLNAPKDLYGVTGGEHVLAYFCNPKEYMNHVKEFLDKYVK